MAKPTDRGLAKFLAPLVLGNMLNPLNSTMLATAVLTIVAAFRQDPGAGALLIIPLYFTSAIGQPLMGRLCDVFEPGRINIVGFVLILLSGVVGVSAQSFEWLIVSRILLGLGSSAAYPSSIALVKQRYKKLNMEVPGVTLSVIAIAGQVSLVFGPFLGGILLETFGWKGIFAVNIPLVLLGLALSVKMKRDSNPGKKSINQARLQLFKDLDPLGVLVFSAFLFAFLMTLLYSSYLYVKIPLTILLLIALISIEFKHHKPFIDVKILSMNMLLNTTFLRQIGITFIMYLFLYGLPQWMEQSRQISPHNVGLIMLPFSLTAMALSLLVAKNKNNKLLMTTGVLCVIVSTIGIFMLHTASPVYFIVGITIVIGAALGILTVSNQATLYAEVPDDQVGVCFGLFRTVGYIGAMLAGSSLKHQFKSGATDAGLHQLALFSLVACVLIVALLLPLFLKRRKIEIDLEITI